MAIPGETPEISHPQPRPSKGPSARRLRVTLVTCSCKEGGASRPWRNVGDPLNPGPAIRGRALAGEK